MPKITVKCLGQADVVLELKEKENIYQALAAAGLMSAPCGGFGLCGKCRVRVLAGDVYVCPGEERFFSAAELKDGWRLACMHLAKDAVIELPAKEKAAEIKVDGHMPEFELEKMDGYGLIVDIGSTTLAASLVDMQTGNMLDKASRLNSQGAFGQDVLSRISYAGQEENGLEKLHNAIVNDLNILCQELLKKTKVSADDVHKVVIAGNSTMIHLLIKCDPSSLGRAPYKPAFEGSPAVTAGDLGLPFKADLPVYCLPAVSAFIGGDITAGALACRLTEAKDRVLFIDIGTNGEIILSDRGHLLGCSCATGPALEGMNISCGTIAKNGAIEDVTINENGEVEYVTIGGEAPNGLCGSGLLAAVAELVRNGLLDKRGRLQVIAPVVEHEGKRALKVCEDMYLTQQDVRQVQLAKGAILSGIEALLKAAGMTGADLDRVIVAGQFGSHLAAEDLIDCGMLPKETAGKIEYAGNTSLSGAYLCLVGRGETEAAAALAGKVDYLELSYLPDYQKEFVRCMSF